MRHILYLQYFLLLLAVVNGIAFFSYYIDKRNAQHNSWRTPERTLLMWGLIGPFGAYLAMRMFRHKTQKTKFLLVPVFLAMQLMLITFVLAKIVP
ncbi:MAG: DUF1294 domain-containing protein [Methanomicrobiales archaeon]